MTPKAPLSSSSGNAQIFTVEKSSTGITEVQFSPVSESSTHAGQYYKITYADGSKVKVVDPEKYVPTFQKDGMPQYDKNTIYVNPQGKEVIFNSMTNTGGAK